MGEILRKVLAEIENQLLRRTAAIGLSDFFHNVRRYHVKGLRYVENSKVRRFQLRSDNGVQQVQAVVALTFSNAPGSHFQPPSRSEKICPLSAAQVFHPLPQAPFEGRF